jgi:DNA polymerase (family X)
MTNLEISKILRNVSSSYIIKNEAKYRFQIIAYKNAADAIDGLNVQVKDLYKENRLDEIPGVGITIKERLIELIKTGQVSHFNEVMKGIPPSVFVLLDVPSIGPKKAYKLASHFHLENPETVIDDLEKLANLNEISKMEGFGEKSQEDILRSINEYREKKGKASKMTLPFANEITKDVLEYLKKNKYVSYAEPLGSLRRKKALVGDIDIAVTSNNPVEVIEYFTKYPRKDRIIEKGPTTSSLLTNGGNQIDLMVLPPDMLGSLLAHFTGSKNHNIALREFALKKGLSLSERGIKVLKTGKLEKYKTEEDFYRALGLTWIPPELREDSGEIELAEKNKLPEIIDINNIKGDLHLHSSFPIEPSHDLGVSTIEEMILKAKELKYEYIGLSEHNPSQSKHSDIQIIDLIKKRNHQIDQISAKLKFNVLKLMETDILPNGNLALPNKALDELNGTIVSIHSVFKMNRNEMTKRILYALSHPKAKILAHPTGRILNDRPGYEIDFEAIFEFCAKNQKALEINAYPNRLDLADTNIKLAAQANVKMIINTDSHSSSQMSNMIYGVYQARRGWATKSDIINTLSYNKVKNWLSK